MTQLKVNPEFFRRHLAVALLLFGMGCWFGYDGYVKYPAQDEAYFAERHLERENAIRRQREFMILALLASAAVGFHLWRVCAFRFAFTDESFTFGGVTRRLADIESVDRSAWEKKRIVKVDGITLDAWHHLGVREFVERLEGR